MSFSKQSLIDAGIPIELTIEDIYNEYSAGGLTELPRASLCKTIISKFPEIKTLGDLFTLSPKGKCYFELQEGILAMAPTLRAVYDASALRRTAFSRQGLIDAGVPVDLTIEDIYKKLQHGGLKGLPRVTMCRTIMNKHPEIKTVADLFSVFPKGKCYDEFREGIIRMAPELSAIYDTNTPIVLPRDTDVDSLEEGLRCFLPEYIAEKRKRAVNYKDSTEKYCITLQMMFDEYSKDTSRAKVASILSVPRQSVDMYIKKARQEFKDLFLSKKNVDGIVADSRLIGYINLFRSEFIVPGTLKNMKKISQIQSPRMLELLCLILDFNVLESGIVQKNGAIARELGLNVGRVKKILKNEGIPVSFEDFRYLLKQDFSDARLRHELVKFVRGNHEFEILTINNREYIAVKWEYLNDLDSELMRILFDKGAWGPANAISRDDLKREWELRVKRTGRKLIQFTPRYHNWRFCVAGNGYVMLRWTKSYRFEPGQKYISSLVLNNPSWTFDDILDQAKRDGYTNIYTEKSIRAYFTNMDKNTEKIEDALREALRVLGKNAGKPMAFNELFDSLKAVRIKKEVFRKWIIKNDKVFDYYSPDEGRKKYIRVIDEHGDLVTTERKGKQPSSTRTVLPPKTTAPSVREIDWNTIRAWVSIQIPEVRQFPQLSGSIDKIFTIMKKGQENLPYDSPFYGWLPNLVKSNMMASWDKDGVRKGMLLSVEPFLDNFYELKKGVSLKTDIEIDPYYDGKLIGLAKKLNHLVSKGLFPDNRVVYNNGSLELTLVRARKVIIDGRNEVGHPQNTVNLADSVLSVQIHDTLLLFLYLASEL